MNSNNVKDYNNNQKVQEIKKVIGNFMLSSEEIMLAMGLTQSTFSRFVKKTNLKPSRTLGRRKFYHVLSFEDAIKRETNVFQIMELIDRNKQILGQENE